LGVEGDIVNWVLKVILVVRVTWLQARRAVGFEPRLKALAPRPVA
jgi:hypothetical protein